MWEALGQFGAKGLFGGPIRFFITAAMASTCFVARADQNVALAWDPSPDTNVVGYVLYYGSVSGSYPSRFDVGTNTTTTVSGLKEGQNYFFVVAAYNAQNLESEPSNEVAFVVPGVVRLTSTADPVHPVTLSFPVAPARSYQLQATADFSSWLTIWQTNSPVNCWVTFADPQAMIYRARFYRVALMPQ